MNYIGTDESCDTAPYFRIRVGTADGHTAFTVAMNLALKLAETEDPASIMLWFGTNPIVRRITLVNSLLGLAGFALERPNRRLPPSLRLPRNLPTPLSLLLPLSLLVLWRVPPRRMLFRKVTVCGILPPKTGLWKPLA